jgi:hypothetical protein
MRKLMVIIMALVFLGMASPIFAETLNTGKPDIPVIVYKTEDLMDFAIKHLMEGGKVTDTIFIKTIQAVVPNGTRCSVIETKIWGGMKKIRILEGEFEGAVGWVQIEFVKQ